MKNILVNKIKIDVRTFIINNFFFGGMGIPFGDKESFLEKGIVDSTGILELINFIEIEYGITIEEEEMLPENLDSLNNISKFVTFKQNNNDK